MTVIDKMIETLAELRKVSKSAIIEELKANDEYTKNQLFLLACAFKAAEV